MNSAVSCADVHHSFTRKTQSVDALCGVSLELQAGEFVAIRGKSGCGKSTLMLCLGGLQRPKSGTVTVANQSVYELTAEQRAAFRARQIGYVFQQFHLIPYLTVLENVMAAQIGLPSQEKQESKQRASALVERVDLSDRADHKPAELSIGECQRVAIARSLMNRPKLILADEPTGNLDEENTENVLKTLRSIANDGTAVLLVTHDAQCEGHVDRVLQMQAGKFVDR